MERATLGLDVDGQRLRRIRKGHGKSASQLAREAKISAQYLLFIERGERRPLPPVFERICTALGVDADARQELIVTAEPTVASVA